jgi:hypothetical protein
LSKAVCKRKVTAKKFYLTSRCLGREGEREGEEREGGGRERGGGNRERWKEKEVEKRERWKE